MVEITHIVHNDAALEMVQADHEEVVAREKVTAKALAEKAKHTQLELASGSAHATGLEIRGDSVAYAFETAQANNSASSANSTDMSTQQGN